MNQLVESELEPAGTLRLWLRGLSVFGNLQGHLSSLSSVRYFWSLANTFATAAMSLLFNARRTSFCARVVIVPLSFVSLRRLRMVVNAFCATGESVSVLSMSFLLVRK